MADSREIVLNVYDFDDVPASRFLAWMKVGIHHSAVMIGNREWTFSDAGVFTMRPRAAPRCTLRESIVLAEHRGSYNDVTAVVQSLRAHFPPGSYDLCKKNCNHFAEAFCQALVGVSIPSWVNRAAGFGSAIGLGAKSLQVKDPDAASGAGDAAGAAGVAGEAPAKPVDAKARVQKKELTEQQKAMLAKIKKAPA